jgi:hypothetical protein
MNCLVQGYWSSFWLVEGWYGNFTPGSWDMLISFTKVLGGMLEVCISVSHSHHVTTS